MEVKTLKREFKFVKDWKEKMLPDPNPAWSTTKVKDYYTSIYPSLINSTIGEPVFTNESIIYEFTSKPGTKG